MKLAKWPSNWGPFLYALGSGGIICKSAWGPDADLRAKVLIHLAVIHTNVGVAVLIVTPDKTTASPTKSRYRPSSTAKNIASASLYCGAKFEN
jgi:hypothetical protein